MKHLVVIFLLILTASFLSNCNRIRNKAKEGMHKIKAKNEDVNDYLSPTPEENFEQSTGLKIPTGATVLSTSNSYMINEGVFTIVMKYPKENLQSLLKSNPPWNSNQWQTGLIPENILCNCGLNPDSLGNLKENYFMMIADSNISYASISHCCGENDPFRNGNLLIVDLSNSLIWYSYWDY